MDAKPVTLQPAAVQAASSPALKFAKDVAAGTCGGVAVTLVGHPFDTLKVRLQTQSMEKPLYNGMIDCAKKTVQWEGLGGLYKGVTSPLAGQMAFRASLFSTFGWAKRWLGTAADGSARELTAADFYKAGAITGFVAAFFESPIDFYKSQIQVQVIRQRGDPNYVAPYTKVSDCVKQTLAANGARGPFQGLAATVLRNTPANSIYLGSFEVMKRYAAEHHYHCPTTELPAGVVLGAAGLGGLAYWAVIFPVDVVKSAMQTDSIHKDKRVYQTIPQTATKLWSEGGVKRFYKGFTPCIIRAMPANAAMLFTVERVGNLLNKA